MTQRKRLGWKGMEIREAISLHDELKYHRMSIDRARSEIQKQQDIISYSLINARAVGREILANDLEAKELRDAMEGQNNG